MRVKLDRKQHSEYWLSVVIIISYFGLVKLRTWELVLELALFINEWTSKYVYKLFYLKCIMYVAYHSFILGFITTWKKRVLEFQRDVKNSRLLTTFFLEFLDLSFVSKNPAIILRDFIHITHSTECPFRWLLHIRLHL